MDDCDSSNPPSDGAKASRWPPPSILLGRHAHVVASRNETTAAAKSRCGLTVEVTFWIADPPAGSFYTFHCTKAPISDSDDAKLVVGPQVVGAEGRFVFLRTRFASGDGEDEYFMYKADTESPSLECVPLPDDDRLVGPHEFGIVPRGDGGDYLLVALGDAAGMLDYRLHIYSSEDGAWRTEELLNPCPGTYTILPEKAITLREGVLAWVDFWRGILMCDLHQKPPVVRYIPLPKPLPDNIQKLDTSHPGSSPRRFRDLTCTDGVIKFIEMEHRIIIIPEKPIEIAPEKPSDPSHEDVLYDSELIMPRKRKEVESKPKKLRSINDGWRAVTWTRTIESNCWLKGCAIDVDDISVDDSAYATLLSGQRDGSLGSLTFKKLYSAWPILSTDGDDLLYLKSLLDLSDPNGWVVAIDLAKKTLKVEAVVRSFGRFASSYQTYRPCTLSNHLNVTPGIKVPAFCQITLAGSSANDPTSTAVGVGEPDSCQSENKRPRLSAEKVNYAQNGAQSIVQNVHISRVCPDQNNLPLQICFEARDGTCYPGYSAWPHKNIPPQRQCFNKWDRPCDPGYAPLAPAPNFHSYGNYQPQWWQAAPSNVFGTHESRRQCFNKWDGPCDPGYAALAPAPNFHSYGNYQPQWWQPPPPEQQLAPSSVFGPHEAPQPCFNNWSGASNHWYSQQLPARNSYAYGTHRDYGNYQRQWQ